MHKDFLEFISALNRHHVKFVIIGGLALAYYGHPRYTGDLDIWVYPDEENARKTFRSIEKFFNTTIAAREEPVQIQIHIHLDGITSQEIWDNRVMGKFGKHDVYYIGKDEFIKNKMTVGRTQDIADIEKIKDA